MKIQVLSRLQNKFKTSPGNLVRTCLRVKDERVLRCRLLVQCLRDPSSIPRTTKRKAFFFFGSCYSARGSLCEAEQNTQRTETLTNSSEKNRKPPSPLERKRGRRLFPACSYAGRDTVEQTWGKLARPLTHTEFKLMR